MRKMSYAEKKINKRFDKIKNAPSSNKRWKIQNRALIKFTNNRLSFAGFLIFAIIVLMCIFAPIITQYKPTSLDLAHSLNSPGGAHIFGTDKLGRDIFARILYGGRISIFIGFGSAVGAAVLGVGLGAYAGYRGGWVDSLLLRISEAFMSFPQIILVLLLVTMVGQSMWNLIFIFVVTGWGGMFRITRAQMMSIREEEYVQALRAFGLGKLRICYKHLLPNTVGAIMVGLTLNTAMFILQESVLSFLGLGVPFEIATWGNIINVANDLNVLSSYWWIWLPVGIVISLFVICVNLIGDGLRDATDPTQLG